MLTLGLKGFKDWYHYNGCKSIKRGNKASHDNKQSFCLSLLQSCEGVMLYWQTFYSSRSQGVWICEVCFGLAFPLSKAGCT